MPDWYKTKYCAITDFMYQLSNLWKVPRKIYFGRKCLFLLLGAVCLTAVLVLVTILLVNNDDLFLQLSSKDDVNDIVSSLPQCSPIDTSQLWAPKHQVETMLTQWQWWKDQALVVGLGRGGQDPQVMEIVANSSTCKVNIVITNLVFFKHRKLGATIIIFK